VSGLEPLPAGIPGIPTQHPAAPALPSQHPWAQHKMVGRLGVSLPPSTATTGPVPPSLPAATCRPHRSQCILASTIVTKENFSSAVSGHLVHTVKCLFLWVLGFFFSFLVFFVVFFRFHFCFPASPRALAKVTNQECVNMTLVKPALAVFINCKVEKVSPVLIKKS